MIRMVRHGKEKDDEVYEPVEWPPRRRSEPTPERRPATLPQREPQKAPPQRKREKVPA